MSQIRNNPTSKHCQVVPAQTSLPIYHRGPNLSNKGLPALFYFALSGQESLDLDPFNQPSVFLSEDPVHVFSFDLPGHGEGFNKLHAMQYWAKELNLHHDIVSNFAEEGMHNISILIDEGYIDPDRIAVAGLSRGGFLAAHLAAKDPRISAILGYAPLTQLNVLEEFSSLSQDQFLQSLNLKNIADALADKKLRFYIGNRDIRVGTEECFQCVKAITEAAYKKGIRSPQTELVISPSIGHNGHGTAPYIFQEGIHWLKSFLLPNKLNSES